MEYHDELDDTGEDDYGTDNWTHGHNNYPGYPRLSDRSSDSGSRTRPSSSVYQLPLHYYASSRGIPRPSPVKVQAKESVSSLLFCLSSQIHDFLIM